MGTPILFSPENVRNVLVKLPSVAALLPDPALEGEPSDAFPGVLRRRPSSSTTSTKRLFERLLWFSPIDTTRMYLANGSSAGSASPTLKRSSRSSCSSASFTSASLGRHRSPLSVPPLAP
jgi:hypothetical protein